MTRHVAGDRMGRTELHYACADGEDQRVRQLMQEGSDCNATDTNGWTPLHFAAEAQALSVLELLLVSGANVDPVDSNGNTPLWKAVFTSRGDGAAIEKLRAAGADPYRRNNHGVSPLSLARNIANYDVARHFSDLPEGT